MACGVSRVLVPFVHVEDAAEASVAATRSRAGRLQYCGRRSLGDARVAARICGVPRCAASTHYRRRGAPSSGGRCVFYATRLHGASNAHAKRKLGFAPRKLEWLSSAKVAARYLRSDERRMFIRSGFRPLGLVFERKAGAPRVIGNKQTRIGTFGPFGVVSAACKAGAAATVVRT